MRIVVTGSSGFIGGHVVEQLARRGDAVTGIDRRPPAASRAADAVLVCDLGRPDAAAARALCRADAVVHLAGRPGVRDAATDAGSNRYRDNVLVVREVLRLVPDDVPLVAVSSSSVYGGAPGGRASREDDPLRPRGGYARSKLLGEAVCRQAAAARRGPVTVVRPFTVVGDGQRADMALHRWVSAALRGEPLTVLGSPDRTRDLTDVRDAAAVLAALTRCAAPAGGAVNVGTGRAVTLRAMVDAVAAATGTRPAVRLLPAAPDEAADTLADVTRLVALTGRRPVTDLADVVARVRDDVLATGALSTAGVAG